MLAIILVLGVLLYEYVPSNKIVPEKISYITPQEVSEELKTSEDELDEDIEPPSYSIDTTDLTNYKKTKDYVPGKKNPFASIDNGNTTNQNQGNNGQTATGTENNKNNIDNSNSSNGNEKDDNSTGYLPDKGTK